MLIITTKPNLSIGADPAALKKLSLCKSHGAIFPLSEGGEAENEAMIAQLSKALKFEQILRMKCELKITDGVTAFKKIAKTYHSNRRCLLVALSEDNARQPLQYRLSLKQLIALANQYDILKCLNEPAKIWTEPKSSGVGERVICSFGPVARAAQHMVVKLLRMTYQPQDFQFTHLGSAQKVQLAMSLIKEKGYQHVAEIDIKDFFPSFGPENLFAALPLPKEATRQIVMTKSADWHPSYGHTTHSSYIPTPLGIPQGSVSSSEVALWCVAQLKMNIVKGVEVINHADNFFIFATSKEALEHAAKALSTGIAGLPGGDFIGDTKQSRRIAEGFRMLGCWVSVEKGELIAQPTNANLQKLWGRTSLEEQRVHAKLAEANIESSDSLRISGLQDYLRLESLVRGWINAFKFCGPQIICVEDELEWNLYVICKTYEITPKELKPLKDASTVVNINWYSGK